MQQLYQKALAIKSAIPHPRIMGIIRECGGKMHMTERQWADAATDFFEAFKNYDEAGNQRRIQCLKYVLCCQIIFIHRNIFIVFTLIPHLSLSLSLFLSLSLSLSLSSVPFHLEKAFKCYFHNEKISLVDVLGSPFSCGNNNT